MNEDAPTGWNARHRLWLGFVNSVAETLTAAASFPRGPSRPPLTSSRCSVARHSAGKVLICSPHPDDEALVGALPLRLLLENGADVVNCAITLGSNQAQRPRRLEELQASCAVLGFRLVVLDFPNGLDRVKPAERSEGGGPDHPWHDKVRTLCDVFDAEQPDLLLFPHAADLHEAHIGTNLLALDALRLHLQRNPRLVLCAETEYWRPMERPNLMLGVSSDVEAVLVMAAAEHGGEVRRNPYHIQHPARLIDNARRGAEGVGGSGARSCNFHFAELYRVFFMTDGQAIEPRAGGTVVGPSEELSIGTLKDSFLPNPERSAG